MMLRSMNAGHESVKHTNAAHLGKRCTIHQGDVAALPYPDRTLDYVTNPSAALLNKRYIMRIVYGSRTGLGKKFAEKLPYPLQSVFEPVSSPCILITRNEGLGQIPKPTQVFLKQYSTFVKGIVVNGNKRFGRFYCAAGPKIESRSHVPVIRNIEGEGTDEDARAVAEFIQSVQDAGENT